MTLECEPIRRMNLEGEPNKVKVKINTHGNPLPEIRGKRAFPLSVEDVELKAGEYTYISLDIAVDPPEGYYVHLTTSNAVCKHYGIQSVEDLKNNNCKGSKVR